MREDFRKRAKRTGSELARLSRLHESSLRLGNGAWVEKAAASGAFAKAPHGVQFNLLKYLTELSSLKSAR